MHGNEKADTNGISTKDNIFPQMTGIRKHQISEMNIQYVYYMNQFAFI